MNNVANPGTKSRQIAELPICPGCGGVGTSNPSHVCPDCITACCPALTSLDNVEIDLYTGDVIGAIRELATAVRYLAERSRGEAF